MQDSQRHCWTAQWARPYTAHSPPEPATATLETKFNLVRAITLDTGQITCTGQLVHRGTRVCTAEARLTSARDQKLLAHGTSTCLDHHALGHCSMTKPNTPTTDDPTTTEEPLRSHRPGIEKDGAPVSYAKKNLRDVKDSAAEHGLSAHQAARFPGEALGCEQTGMNFLVVKPRQREAFAHTASRPGPAGSRADLRSARRVRTRK